MIVRVEHIRRLGYCAKGAREFFARYGLDYADFLANGIDSELLLKSCNNDQMAVDAVGVACGE